MRRNGHLLLGTVQPIYWDEADPPKPRGPRLLRSARAGEATYIPAQDDAVDDIPPSEIERRFQAAKARLAAQRRQA